MVPAFVLHEDLDEVGQCLGFRGARSLHISSSIAPSRFACPERCEKSCGFRKAPADRVCGNGDIVGAHVSMALAFLDTRQGQPS